MKFGNDLMYELGQTGMGEMPKARKRQILDLMGELRVAQGGFEPVAEEPAVGRELFNPYKEDKNPVGAKDESEQAAASPVVADRGTPSPRPHSGFAASGRDRKGGSPGGAAAGIGKLSLAPVEEEGSPRGGGAGIWVAAKNLIAGLFGQKDGKGEHARYTIRDAVNQEHELYKSFDTYCKAHYAAESMGFLRRIDSYLAEPTAGLASEILQQSGAAVAKLEDGLRASVGAAGGASIPMTFDALPRPSQGEVNLSSVLKAQLNKAYLIGPASAQMKAAVQESRSAICAMLEADVFPRFLKSLGPAA